MLSGLPGTTLSPFLTIESSSFLIISKITFLSVLASSVSLDMVLSFEYAFLT